MSPPLRGLPQDDVNTRYSKTLAYLLRHGADKHKLTMRKDGYVRVRDLLSQPNLTTLSFPHLHHLVTSNAKQRFTLLYAHDPTTPPLHKQPVDELPLIQIIPIPEVPAWDPNSSTNASVEIITASSSTSPAGEWFIRAAQGHSLKAIEADQLLEEITQVDEESLKKVGEMVHGTKWENWESIRETGLSRMNRQHIHLTTSRYNSTSGPRLKSDLFIYLSLPELLSSNPPLEAYISSNAVVLTPGNEEGRVPSKLFKKVIRARKEFMEIKPDEENVIQPSSAGVEVNQGNEDAKVAESMAEIKLEGKAGKASRRAKKGGHTRQVREWDEVIWEDGKAVDPPRVEVAESKNTPFVDL